MVFHRAETLLCLLDSYAEVTRYYYLDLEFPTRACVECLVPRLWNYWKVEETVEGEKLPRNASESSIEVAPHPSQDGYG